MTLSGRAEDGAGTSQGTFGLSGFASANPANRGDAPVKSLKLGELFCGAGGMALGASLATYGGWSYEHAWATDIDRDSCKTIEQVVDGAKIVRRDVNDVDFDELQAAYGPIDGLIFGFPCNDFSVVGERRGIEGEYGGLYKFGVNGLLKLQPKFFVAENVSGLPGQPNHPRVQEFEATVRNAVHAAGKRMADDAMDSARVANLFMDGARAFLAAMGG